MPNLFPILIDVEELAVGRVLRKLNSLEGVARIHLRLQEAKDHLNPSAFAGLRPDKPEIEGEVAERPVAQRLVDGRSVRWRGKPADSVPYRAIAEVLQHTPAHLKTLGQGLLRVRLPAKSISGYMHRMVKLKLAKRVSPGNYKLTELGFKTFFGGKQPARVLPPDLLKITNNHSGFRHLILTTLKAELDNDPDGVGIMSSSDMKRTIVQAGYSDKNLSSQGMKMRQEELIEFNNGHYSITDKGVNALADAPEMSSGIINPTEQEDATANG